MFFKKIFFCIGIRFIILDLVNLGVDGDFLIDFIDLDLDVFVYKYMDRDVDLDVVRKVCLSDL